MKHIVELDENGHLVYDGLLSSKEKATIDEILNTLKEEIPLIENELEKKYGKNVLYKYYLGKFLGELLDKYNISYKERRLFWNEIKTFATKENRKRDEGVKSVTRSFYEQCYVLSQHDLETAEKLSWRQWQSILDRVDIREDNRFFEWIKYQKEKIREDDLREFVKALHLYLQKKDTAVFSSQEIFNIYDKIFEMCKYWRVTFAKFEKENPKSAKIKRKSALSKKYHENCFILKKNLHKDFDEEIYQKAMEIILH